MTRQGLNRTEPVTRRQGENYLLQEEKKRARKTKTFGEVVGGTTAECTAVFCCCPCTVLDFLVLGLYTIPTGLCKKAIRRIKRRRLAKTNQMGLLRQAQRCPTFEELEAEVDDMLTKGKIEDGVEGDEGMKKTVDLEKEMWDRFHKAGFWRSTSTRDT